MDKKSIRVPLDFIKVIAPNEFLAKVRKKNLENKINALEMQMVTAWIESSGVRLKSDWKPAVNEEVMVLKKDDVCRGLVLYTFPGDQDMYSVFFFDRGYTTTLVGKNIWKLDESFRRLTSLYFIIRIPGIVPAVPAMADHHGIPFHKQSKEQNYVEGEAWSLEAMKIATQWVEKQQSEICVDVENKINKGVILGFLVRIKQPGFEDEYYKECLVNNKVAIESQECYNNDISREWLTSEVDSAETLTIISQLHEDAVLVGTQREPDDDVNESEDTSVPFEMASSSYLLKLNTESGMVHMLNKSPFGKKSSSPQNKTSASAEKVVVTGGSKFLTKSYSHSEDTSSEVLDLFKRQLDPDNCFSNPYNSIKPKPVVAHSEDPGTVSFGTAKVVVRKEAAFQKNGENCTPRPNEVSIVVMDNHCAKSAGGQSSQRCRNPFSDNEKCRNNKQNKKAIVKGAQIDGDIFRNGRYKLSEPRSKNPTMFGSFAGKSIPFDKISEGSGDLSGQRRTARLVPRVQTVLESSSSVKGSNTNNTPRSPFHKQSGFVERSDVDNKTLNSKSQVQDTSCIKTSSIKPTKTAFVCTLPPWSEVKSNLAKTCPVSENSTKPSLRCVRRSVLGQSVTRNSVPEDEGHNNFQNVLPTKEKNINPAQPGVRQKVSQIYSNAETKLSLSPELSEEPDVDDEKKDIDEDTATITTSNSTVNIDAVLSVEHEPPAEVSDTCNQPQDCPSQCAAVSQACIERYDDGVIKKRNKVKHVEAPEYLSTNQLQKFLRGRIFVYGRSPSPPFASLDDFKCKKELKESQYVKQITCVQKVCYPNIMNRRNVFLISHSKKGDHSSKKERKVKGKPSLEGKRCLNYIMPIVADIVNMKQSNNAKKSHTLQGPIALILTTCISSGQLLKDWVDSLKESVDEDRLASRIQVSFIYRNDSDEKKELRYGCDIMITTPEFLLEMHENNVPYLSFERLHYFVVDDLTVLVELKPTLLKDTLRTVQELVRRITFRTWELQTIFVGARWCDELESAIDMVNDPVLIMNSIQAAKFAGVNFKVHCTTAAEKLNQFIDYIGTVIAQENASDDYKVIVVSNDKRCANLLQNCILEQFKFSVLLASSDTAASREKWTASPSTGLKILIVTDVELKELEVTNVNHVVNYDAPSKKYSGLRLSTMWSSFRSSKFRQRRKLISYFFLTPEDKYLTDCLAILEDLGEKIPELLQKECNKQLAGQDRLLCPGFEEHGFCNALDSSHCEYKHYVLPKDTVVRPGLPTSGQVVIRISKVESLSRYFAQLLHHYDYNSQSEKLERVRDYEKELKARCDYFSKYYADPENRVRVTSCEPGSCLCIYDTDLQSFYRAVVQSNEKEYVLFLGLDTGKRYAYVKEKVVQHDVDLFQLPAEHGKELLNFAVEVILANMKPPMGEKKYLNEDKRSAEKLLNEISSAGNVFVGRICLSVREKIWLDPLVEMEIDKDKHYRFRKRSIRMEYFKRKFAESNELHMNNLYEIYERAGRPCEQYKKLQITGLDNEFREKFYQKGDSIQWAHLAYCGNIDVNLFPSFVVHKDQMFCTNDKFLPQLDDLNREMNEELNILEKNAKILHSSMLKQYFEKDLAVAVKDPKSNNGEWARGLIVTHKETETGDYLYNVFLVDVGEQLKDLVLNNLAPIPKVFVNRLPFQVIALKLSHVEPLLGSEKMLHERLEDILFPNGHSTSIIAQPYCKVEQHGYPPCSSYGALIFLDDFEVGEKLVSENYAAYKADAEGQVKLTKARLLQKLNDRVDANLGDKQSKNSKRGSSDGGSIESDGSDVESQDEIDGWDFCMGANAEEVLKSLCHNLPQSLPAPQGSSKEKSVCPARTPQKPDSVAFAEAGVNKEEINSLLSQDNLRHPKVVWSQTPCDILLRILVPDVKKCDFTVDRISKKILSFQTLQPEGYGFQMELLQRVESDYCMEILGSGIKIKLKKRLQGKKWSKLTTGKYKWISLDINSLEDCDDDEDEHGDLVPLTPGVVSSKDLMLTGEYKTVQFESDSSSSDGEGMNCELEELMA